MARFDSQVPVMSPHLGGGEHLLSRRPIDAPTSGLVFPTTTGVSSSQPRRLGPWHCASALGPASVGRPARMQSCGWRRAATIGVIQMSPKRKQARHRRKPECDRDNDGSQALPTGSRAPGSRPCSTRGDEQRRKDVLRDWARPQEPRRRHEECRARDRQHLRSGNTRTEPERRPSAQRSAPGPYRNRSNKRAACTSRCAAVSSASSRSTIATCFSSSSRRGAASRIACG